MTTAYRHRLIPYKLLAFLLYGDRDFILFRDNHIVRISTGKCARALRISNSRLWESIEWLHMSGIVASFERPERGVAVIKLNQPTKI